MANKKKAKEIADDLGKLYRQMVDSYEIGDFYGHFCAELRVLKDFHEHKMPGALSADKINALEKAVEQFRMIYDAEKAEAEKMPLSWAEAARVQKLFDEADEFKPLPDAPLEH
jgi:hypothetical protein